MGAFAELAALVTGGASGIGPATARLLTDEGARVAVLDVAAQAPEEFAAHLNGDISDDASVVAAVRDAVRALGGLDVLVDNAGSAPKAVSRATPTKSGTGCWT